MSLTEFISIPEIRQWLSEQFTMPSVKTPVDMQVEPKSANYGLIGTAFDYLLRFKIKQLNTSASTKPWVAEVALNTIPQDYDETELKAMSKSRGIPIDILRDFEDLKIKRQPDSLRTKVEKLITEANQIYNNYLESGIMNDDVIRSSVHLAQIDPIYRANYIDPNMGKVDNIVIQELKELIAIADDNLFIAKKHCFLNPTFGIASREVGGADADFIIDGCLVDIKTTKSSKFTRELLNQLVGYYLLNEIGGINGKRNVEINTMGIYFSRYGSLCKFPVNQLINENFSSLVKWFRKKMKETYG